VKQIFLDTNIYLYCSLQSKDGATPGLIRELGERIQNADAQLLLPQVVLDEYDGTIDANLLTAETNIKRFKSEVCETNLAIGPDRARVHLLLDQLAVERRAAVAKAKEELSALAKSGYCRVIPLSPGALVDATRMALRHESPSKSGQGLLQGDCLIVASLAEYLRDCPESDTLLLCTSDTDFSAPRRKGDQTMRLAPAIASQFSQDVRMYPSLPELLDQGLGQVVTEDFGDESTYQAWLEQARHEDSDRALMDTLTTLNRAIAKVAAEQRRALDPTDSALSNFSRVFQMNLTGNPGTLPIPSPKDAPTDVRLTVSPLSFSDAYDDEPIELQGEDETGELGAPSSAQ